MPRLTPQEQQEIIRYIEQDKPLPLSLRESPNDAQWAYTRTKARRTSSVISS